MMQISAKKESLQLDWLQMSAMGLNTATQSPQKSENKSGSKDQFNVSTLSRAAQQTGLDIANSSRYISSSELHFDFHYHDTQIQNINASGIYQMQSRSMEMNFSFEMNESLIVDGKETSRTLRFSMNIRMEQMDYKSLNVHQNKEGLPDFLHRIAKTIAQYARDKDKEITHLILDKEDVRELLAFDNGKMLKDIFAAIQIIYVTNQILDKDKEDVAVYIPRKKETVLEYNHMQEERMEISFSVEEIRSKMNSEDSPAEKIEEEKPAETPSNTAIA